MLEDIFFLKDLTDQERFLHQTTLAGSRKETAARVLLCFFLGGFGAHRFYMGEKGLRILYLVFCWTLIPGLVALVECFLIPKRVREYNKKLSNKIALKLKSLRE